MSRLYHTGAGPGSKSCKCEVVQLYWWKIGSQPASGLATVRCEGTWVLVGGKRGSGVWREAKAQCPDWWSDPE